ncbi:MAG: 3-phosphoshikimate 1-carboxyvinyltransferase [Turicibacter sp.]|nr:3-phosphoshikimate 1-carboxyvinyltransferase [Turicibacter sp.]
MKIAGKNTPISGVYTVPGDKSISHRSVILGAIAAGTTQVSGFLTGEDCLATISCFRELGVKIDVAGSDLTIFGGNLQSPENVLFVGNSGTTLRLLSGLVAGLGFSCTFDGDSSIRKRPMKRVIEPLTAMGAAFNAATAPLSVACKNKLTGIEYTLPVASAQVKSAILLAGLYAVGTTTIIEPTPTRNHTEIMLKNFGADIEVLKKPAGNMIKLRAGKLKAQNIKIPGDISSAAFLIALAVMTPHSHITIKEVGVNPTRTGIIHVLRRMGADIFLHNEHLSAGEPMADIEVSGAKRLTGTIIGGTEIPTLIDELPIIAVIALFADSQTIIKNAEELRVKETDRISAICEEFNKFFENDPITPTSDGMIISGNLKNTKNTIPGNNLKNTKNTMINVSSHGDHRLAMSLTILALATNTTIELNQAECTNISFPNFYNLLNLA